MHKHINKSFTMLATTLLTGMTLQNAVAAPEELARSPLFIGNSSEPNIMWSVDDSNSMKWATMMQSDIDDNGVAGLEVFRGTPKLFTDWKNGKKRINRLQYLNPDWSTDRLVVPPPATITDDDPNVTTQQEGLWAIRFHGGNPLYYNPNTEYKPWSGLKENGVDPLYTDADISKVLQNPDKPGGKWTNLNNPVTYTDEAYCFSGDCDIEYYLATYYTWNDDGDGIIEADEAGTKYEIPTMTKFPSGRSQAAELQNFANWFQYYRIRNHAAKAALGDVINNQSSVRMGLDFFHASSQTITDEDGNTGSYMSSMTSDINKSRLLQHLYDTSYAGGTPTREALQRVGENFKDPAKNIILSSGANGEGGECQPNYAIVVTDGFWIGAKSNLTNINNTDINGASSIYDGNAGESNDGGNYADDISKTLADVAMHYYETDLRPTTGYPASVPVTLGVDENPEQHLVTFTVGFGITGFLDYTKDPTDKDFPGWTNPHTSNKTLQGLYRVDDLWHASYNGRGQYLSASNPVELSAALNVALDDIDSRSTISAAASVTSAELTTESLVFLSEFNPEGWRGTILAYNVENLDKGGNLTSTATWSADETLSTITPAERTIITYDHQATPPAGIPFLWNDLNSDMKADLSTDINGDPEATANNGQARLAWIRGDHTEEGANGSLNLNLRARNYVDDEGTARKHNIGDIVHSGPVFVDKPNLGWPSEAPFPTGDSSYSKFKESLTDTDGSSKRTGMIYVGSNDGMIHGFDADKSGLEKLAYIPSNHFSSNNGEGLHYLTQNNYSHRYYNDLTPTASDVYINGAWKTILVAGQRGGGKGYSALNITNPNDFKAVNAAQIAMWEFNSSHDADLGYTFSRPQIGMTNDGKWSVIFGNGYNNSGDGKAHLYILTITGGLDGDWTLDTDYRKIQAGTAGDANSPNGLSTPALADIDGNGTIDRAYAGDLEGKMWVFDLSNKASSNWALADTDPLFTTIGGLPITSQPALSKHPFYSTDDTNTPNIMVAFGSGQYMYTSDVVGATNDNYFYAVWDKNVFGRTSLHLAEQVYKSTSPRVLKNEPVSYATSSGGDKYGWYISLPDTGERVIVKPSIRSNIVFFNTAVPSQAVCSGGGSGWRFAVNLSNGGTPSEPVIDTDDNGVINDSDKVDGEVVAAQAIDNRIPSDDTLTQDHIINERNLIAIKTAPDRTTGRISWQELLQ